VAFRDESEALRFQLQGLEREIAERQKELEEHRHATAEIEAEIAREVKLLYGRGRVIVVVPLLIAAGLLTMVLVSSLGGSNAEVIFGDVRAATGSPPVPAGARCTLFVTPVDDDDSQWDTDVEVLCDERLVYGGERLGGVDCEKIDSRAVLCEDTDFTANGGDPKMRFDRNAGVVVVEDRAPDYRLEIGLAPLPRRLP